MACCALNLKRSHFDLPSSPGQEGFSLEPSAKRRCSLAAIAPCSPRSYNVSGSCSAIFRQSPVSRDRILSDVNGEIRKVRRRRRYLTNITEGKRNDDETSAPSKKDTSESVSSKEKSRSDGMASTPNSKSGDANTSKEDKPVFSARQVADFCQRKLQEREEELKVLFDQILNERLTEQYDSFVRFTEENLKKRFADRECSYVC